MINKQLLQLNHFINILFNESAKDKDVNAKFLYFLKRNAEIIKPMVDDIVQRMNYPIDNSILEKANEFETKRNEICIELSKKDENNQPIIEDNMYVIDQPNYEEFTKRMRELSEQFPEVLEEKKKQIEHQNNILSESVDISKLYKIKMEYLPDKGIISPEIMDILYELIEG